MSLGIETSSSCGAGRTVLAGGSIFSWLEDSPAKIISHPRPILLPMHDKHRDSEAPETRANHRRRSYVGAGVARAASATALDETGRAPRTAAPRPPRCSSTASRVRGADLSYGRALPAVASRWASRVSRLARGLERGCWEVLSRADIKGCTFLLLERDDDRASSTRVEETPRDLHLSPLSRCRSREETAARRISTTFYR